MKQIINSILDTDLYKLTMQNFVLQHYPDVDVTYTFNNRDKSVKFNHEFLYELQAQIQLMSNLHLTDNEYGWLKRELPFLPITYRQYLLSYRFNPNQVFLSLNNNKLEIQIKGKWSDAILWEVPLMAIISELYFKLIDTDWAMNEQEENMNSKALTLHRNNCKFADFGTRRRRSYDVQDILIKTFSNYRNNCVGTCNPHFAMKYNMKPIGTCAHEAIAGVAALDSLNHPNKVFMEKWTQTYNGRLGIMLPDTFGTDNFLTDFSIEKAKLWDGVRHDSGNPYIFIKKIINHYKEIGVYYRSKTIVFSDSLSTERAIDIKEVCDMFGINCSFGIGTHFTNDFLIASNPSKTSKPLNMVIKLTEANNIPVIKLSDTPDKANGDKKMIEVMKYIHHEE